MSAHLAIALIALIIDRLAGYPDRLFRAIGHPVSWIGRLIEGLDGRLNRAAARDARLRGIIALVLLILIVLAAALAARALAALVPGGLVIEGALAAVLMAQRSLHDHIKAVSDGLKQSLERGRAAVRHVVGRDTARLDEDGICKAAIESLAESMSDGVIAPLFWLCIAGLPGIAVYKAVNTADSMIGHRDARYRYFGWAAARLDDLLNLIPSRLTGAMIVLAALVVLGRREAVSAWTVLRRDAAKHRSPNAGYPEAAIAGALGLTLGGPRLYQGELIDLPAMGSGSRRATGGDIEAALRLYGAVLNTALLAVVTFVVVSI